MEHMWRSGDSFTKAVLFFHYVGPRRQSQVSGLMVGTVIHWAFVLYLETLNIIGLVLASNRTKAV